MPASETGPLNEQVITGPTDVCSSDEGPCRTSTGADIDRALKGSIFERFASRATCWAGSTSAFTVAILLIVTWLACGPRFHYSDTWQLIVNTSTTIITFLMVFLIQRSQNRETLALKVQLGELISALKEADNQIIDLDDLSEQQLTELHRRYQDLSRRTNPLAQQAPESSRKATASR